MGVRTACASRCGQTAEDRAGWRVCPRGGLSRHTSTPLKAGLVSVSMFPDFCPLTPVQPALGDPRGKALCPGLFRPGALTGPEVMHDPSIWVPSLTLGSPGHLPVATPGGTPPLPPPPLQAPGPGVSVSPNRLTDGDDTA